MKIHEVINLLDEEVDTKEEIMGDIESKFHHELSNLVEELEGIIKQLSEAKKARNWGKLNPVEDRLQAMKSEISMYLSLSKTSKEG